MKFFLERVSKMIICKDFDKNKIINSINEWKDICPPEGGEKQWKDGRSAKELAKEWIKNKGKYLETLLDSYEEFKGINFTMASPEYESKFDDYRGKGRQHDLLVLAEDKKGEVLISIEAKADEPFGKIIKDHYLNSIVDRINGVSTKAPDRIENLLSNIFGKNIGIAVFNLRYQLLYAIAGTIAEAKRRNIKRAIFVVNTFCSQDNKNFNHDKHLRNMNDLDQFIRYLSNNSIDNISNNAIIGPFNTMDNKYLSSKIDLYILKIEIIIE